MSNDYRPDGCRFRLGLGGRKPMQMDINDKLDLCNQAYDAMRKLEDAFETEGRTELSMEAKRIRNKILSFHTTITPLCFGDKEE